MGIMKRLRDLTVASVNEVMDSLEDPAVMLNQYMRDLETEIGRVEVSVARQVALEKKFRQQLDEAKATAAKRDRQVMLALQEGEDELARCALLDKKHQETRAEEYEQMYNSARDAAQQMREKLSELKDEFYKMRAKKYTLMARAEVARTQKQLNTVITGMGCESASRGFARMEDKVMRMEAEAEMSSHWKAGAAGLDHSFSTIGKDEIDSELAQLKASIQSQKANKAEEEAQESSK